VSLGRRNVLNQELGEFLAVPTGTAIVLPALLLKHGNRSGPSLPHDFSRDRGSVKKWLSNQNTRIAMYETDLAEFYLGPDVSREPFDLDRRTGFDSILFATRFNDRVHNHPVSELKEQLI
jgi:hypothetical protein